MNLEDLIQDAIENTEQLTKYVKTHQASFIDTELLDELEAAVSELQEVTYELEARIPADEELELEFEE